jgi:hypothetical protein
VDEANRPDLGAVISATRMIAAAIDPGRRPTIIYESTVYPGVTEEICGGELERAGNFQRGRDFRLGYSPERINPGDRVHSIDRITKVIAAEDHEVLEQMAELYGSITSGGVFRAASIKAAEAAKAIENAQRDINIAFINEVAQNGQHLSFGARADPAHLPCPAQREGKQRAENQRSGKLEPAPRQQRPGHDLGGRLVAHRLLVDPDAGVVRAAMSDPHCHAADHGLVDLAAADKAGDAAHVARSFAFFVTLEAT